MAWSDSERADSAMCAALLHTGVIWWGASSLIQLYLLVFFCTSGHWGGLLLSVLIWSGATWMAVRVRLDALLFDQLARFDGPWRDASSLDGALEGVLAVKRPPAGAERGMSARIAGARRLYRLLVALCLVHGACLLYECLRQSFGWGR
ncbi:hypothetical protein [Aquabacterium sp.]|uniref:hypothetical protein n=1 Tax=Aquabacterium sp. TaxID=1872578 RepID=UPI0025C1D8D4|nr:hypothetical protein [Aquabacterium sp.]